MAATALQSSSVIVEIGGLPIRLRCDNPDFVRQIQERYAGYLSFSDEARFDFEIELAPPGTKSGDDDVSVNWESGRWLMERGDFRAEWNPATARGRIQQTINPYSLDSCLRIVHTLLLAGEGGFLLHASSAIRNGRAFLFSGVSGAGQNHDRAPGPAGRRAADRRNFLCDPPRRRLLGCWHAIFRRTGARRRKPARSD